MNDWVDGNGHSRKAVGAPLSEDLLDWQNKLKTVYQDGASREHVRDLQIEGRKLRLRHAVFHKLLVNHFFDFFFVNYLLCCKFK